MASKNYETIEFNTADSGIATLTINRPDKLNALNNLVLDEIESVIEEISVSSEVRALLIAGAGEKAFVAGADIGELAELDKKTGQEASEKGQRIFGKIESLAIPVIAVVDGYALGGGAELAMASHMRFATQKAVIGLPEVTLGTIPGYGGTQRLAGLVGKAKAFEMILSGKPVNSGEALKTGLVNRVEENALKAATELLQTILKNGPLAIARAIQAIHAAGTPDGFHVEASLFGELCDTKDFREGTSAFLEKRKPEFQGH